MLISHSKKGSRHVTATDDEQTVFSSTSSGTKLAVGLSFEF
jgi:hypothetical protein